MTESDKARSGSSAAAVLVGTGILASRMFGLLRMVAQARYLGLENRAADAFTLALRLPNFLQNLLGEGSLSAAFIPVYSSLLARDERERAARIAGAVFSLLALVTSLFVLAGVLLAPVIVPLFTAEWDASARALAVRLARIMFPGTGVLVLSAWCLAILNSHRRFLLSYTAPVIWNLAIVGFLVFAGERGGSLETIVTYAVVGAVAGSMLQFLVQLPLVLNLAGSLSLRLRGAGADIRRIAGRFGPAVAARGSVQISAYIDIALVGFLGLGATAVLGYAQALYQLPISLFGMSVSAAELPEMSAVADGTVERGSERAAAMRRRLGESMQRILFFVIPSAIAFAFFGDMLVSLLLRWKSGAFGEDDVLATWIVLAGFAIGVVPATMSRLVATTFFAMHDTRTPLNFALIRVLVGTVLAVALIFGLAPFLSATVLEHPPWRVAGLSVGSSIAFWLEFALLLSAFEARVGAAIINRGVILRTVGAAAAAGAAGLAARSAVVLPSEKLASVVVLAIFGISYLLAARLLGVLDPAAVARLLRRR